MATVHFNVGTEEKSRRFGADKPLAPAASNDDLPLFRFTLRQLFLFVAGTCTLLAVLTSSRGVTGLIVLMAVAVVFMHVFATALGTRLQLRTEQERLRQQAAQPARGHSGDWATLNATSIQTIRSAPRSPWHGRGCTYLPWLPRLVIGSILVGGLGGGILLSGTIGHRTSPEGIVVGAASFAVLGGWISFLGGNFYGVFRHGFRDALAEQQKDRHPPSAGM